MPLEVWILKSPGELLVSKVKALYLRKDYHKHWLSHAKTVYKFVEGVSGSYKFQMCWIQLLSVFFDTYFDNISTENQNLWIFEKVHNLHKS